MKRKWIVWVAILQHLVWAGCLFVSPSAAGVTAISAISNWLGGPEPSKWVILLVALLALVGLFMSPASGRKVMWFWAIFLIPQQCVLMVSAFGAIDCIRVGMFADGVARPIPFMFADQIPSILIAVFHTCAILDPLITRNPICPVIEQECPF